MIEAGKSGGDPLPDEGRSGLDWAFPGLLRLGADPILLCLEDDVVGRRARAATRDAIRELRAEEIDSLGPIFEWAAAGRSVPIGPGPLGGIEFPQGAVLVPLTGQAGRSLGCLVSGGGLDEAVLAEFAAYITRHREAEFARRHTLAWEAQLERAKRDWERTFDAIRDGILLLDTAGVVTRVNRALKERLGLDFREIIGKPVADLLGQRGAELIRRALDIRGTASTGALPELQGSFEVSAWARFAPDGEREGSVVVLADVTEKEHLREQLLHSEKLSELGELISGIAHELNNPLTAVLGYAQILELKAGGQFGMELTHLREESLRASRIVRNLLTFARRREDRRDPENLNDVVSQTLALREFDLRVHNIRVVTELAEDLPLTLMERSQLQQVVLNLLNNAEYSIRTAADAGCIRLITEHAGGRLRLIVEDDGPGVPPAVRKQIFHPFFTTKPVGRGTGLGLSICFGIIRDHDGEICLESPEGGGARFVIDLPVVAVAEAEASLTPPVPSAEDTREIAASRSILLVDDEPSIRSLGREFLESMGHRVTLAEDGEEALARLGGEEFDAVVCDLRMPKVDGMEVYRRTVGRAPEYRERFVFMSGDSSTVARDVASVPVVSKPFDLEELARAIDSI